MLTYSRKMYSKCFLCIICCLMQWVTVLNDKTQPYYWAVGLCLSWRFLKSSAPCRWCTWWNCFQSFFLLLRKDLIARKVPENIIKRRKFLFQANSMTTLYMPKKTLCDLPGIPFTSRTNILLLTDGAMQILKLIDLCLSSYTSAIWPLIHQQSNV